MNKPDSRTAADSKKARTIKYRCPMTGNTWSGRGLQSRWLKVALASGRPLAEVDMAQQVEAQP